MTSGIGMLLLLIRNFSLASLTETPVLTAPEPELVPDSFSSTLTEVGTLVGVVVDESAAAAGKITEERFSCRAFISAMTEEPMETPNL